MGQLCKLLADTMAGVRQWQTGLGMHSDATYLVMGSCMELRESEMSTCGTLGHALEVAIAHTSYMRGA